MNELHESTNRRILKVKVKHLRKNFSGHAEQIQDVPLIPGVNHTQHLGYVSGIALLCPAAIRLLLESTHKAKRKLFV